MNPVAADGSWKWYESVTLISSSSSVKKGILKQSDGEEGATMEVSNFPHQYLLVGRG